MLTVYEHPFALYCQKVLIAFNELGVAYDVLEEQRDLRSRRPGQAVAIHPWDGGTHPRLTRYYRALAQRPSFARAIANARPYRNLFPLPWPADFDRYH